MACCSVPWSIYHIVPGRVLPRRNPLPKGAPRLPLSTRAPRAVALLGYGRIDTPRPVERVTCGATTVSKQAMGKTI